MMLKALTIHSHTRLIRYPLVFRVVMQLWILSIQAGSLCGQASTWISAESGNWSDANKWSDGVPNGVGDVGVITPDRAFAAPMTISIQSPITLGELSFGRGPQTTVSGSSFLWETGSASAASMNVSANRGSTLVRLRSDQIIQDPQGLIVDVGATASLEMTGIISGGPLTKRGTGGLSLGGNNSNWDAEIQISEGTVVVSHGGALGTNRTGTTIENGTLRLAVATDEPIQVLGGVVEISSNQRGAVDVSGGTVQLRSSLSNSVVSLQGGILDWRGTIDPRTVLSASSTGGTLLLSQTAIFNGQGQVFDWRLLSGGDNLRLGTTDATTLHASLSLIPPASGTIRLGGGKGVMTVRSSIQDFQGQPTSVDYLGPGNVILAGNDTYSGLTTVRNGMLTVDSVNALGQGTSQAADGTRVTNGGVLMFAKQTPANERILLDGGELRFGSVTTPVEMPIQVESLGRFGATTGQITVRDVSSNGGITEFAAGRYLLDRSLALNGPIQIVGATVNIMNEGALGNAQYPTTVESGSLILGVNSSEAIHVVGGRLTIESGANYTGKLTASGGTITTRGDFPANNAPELQGGRTTLIVPPQSYGSGVTGVGSLILSGGYTEQVGQPFAQRGDLEIKNAFVRMSVANSYTGVTEIRDSFVTMAHPQSLGTTDSPTRILLGGNLSLETITEEPLVLAGGALDLRVDPAGQTIQVESGGVRLFQPTHANFQIVDGGSFLVNQGDFRGSFSGPGELRLTPFAETIVLAGDNGAFQGPIVVAGPGEVTSSTTTAFGDPKVPTIVEDGVLRVANSVAERFILRNRGTIRQATPSTHVPDFDERTWSGQVAKTWDVLQNATLLSPLVLQRSRLNAYADVTVPGLALVDDLGAATTVSNGHLHVQGDVDLQRGTLGGNVTSEGEIIKSSSGMGVVANATSLASNIRLHAGDLLIKSDFKMAGQGKKIFVDASPFTRMIVQDATRVSVDIELADGAGRQQIGALLVSQSACCAETILDGNLTIAGNHARIAGGAVQGIAAIWAGQMHGGDLEITGALQVAAAQSEYRGALTINGGRLSFTEEGSFPLVSKVQVLNHATFSFGDDRRSPQHTSRLNSSTELILGDAVLNLANVTLLDVIEPVGHTKLGDGYATIVTTPFMNSRLQLSSLQRTGRGMLDIQAPDGQLGVTSPVAMTSGIVNWVTMNGKLATYSQGAFRELQVSTPIANALATDHALVEGNVTMDTDRTVASLSFQTGELDLGGHRLTVGTGALSSGAVVSNGTLTSGDSQGELFLNNARIGASIVDQPGRAVNVILNNTELSGFNTYTGTTTVLNFVSTLRTPNSLPNGTDLLIGSEAALKAFYFEPLVLGKLQMANSSFLEHGGGISFTSAEIEGAFVGHLIGAGSLTKRGHGPATIGDSPNYSGAVRIEDGSLVAEISLGTGTLTLAGGELIVGTGNQFFNPIEVDSGKIQTLSGPLNVPLLVRNQVLFSGARFDGKLTGSGSFILSAKQSTDVTTWTGDTSDFQGTLIVESGVVDLDKFSANLLVQANGTLQLHDQNAIRKISLQGGTIRTTPLAARSLAGDMHLSGNSQLEVVSGSRLIMSGVTDLDRATHLSLVGEGTVEFSGLVRLPSEARFVGLQPQVAFTGNLETTQPQTVITLDLLGQHKSPFQGRLIVHSEQVLQVVDRDQQLMMVEFETSEGVLLGAGRLANSVRLANHATLEPGELHRVGQLHIDGNATLAEANFTWDFQAAMPNVMHDELLVGGTLTFVAASDPSTLTLRGVTADGQVMPMTTLLSGSDRSWPLVRAQSIVGFNAGRYAIDATQLLAPNQIALHHGLQLRADGQTLWLDYDPLAAGDFDRDGQLDVGDLSPLFTAIQTQIGTQSLDLNHDQRWTFEDLEVWVHDRATTYFGDANLDGEFNSRDLVNVFVAGTYEDVIPHNSTWEMGDWNGDGDFTSADLVVAFQSGGYERGLRTSRSSESQMVPEPSRLMGMVSCALGCWQVLIKSRRRRVPSRKFLPHPAPGRSS